VTVNGQAIPDVPDLVRMRRERSAKLQAQLEAQGLAGLVLLASGNVSYATGAELPGQDSARAALLRTVAVVVRGDPEPHLFTPYPECAARELPDDHVHPALWPDVGDCAGLSGLFPPDAKIGVDELPWPLARTLATNTVVHASTVLGPAKITKTADELACIRVAQRINELAMVDVQPLVDAGVRQTDLTATLLRRVFELGATSNGIDPIWQPMPLTRTAGPWTTHGDLAFPTASTDRILRHGDVIWVDAGIHYHGYASDFGRTWLVGDAPTPRQQRQFERWRVVVQAVLDVCKPGVTALELCRAAIVANGGRRPWIEHFYLSHAVGTDSAEAPMIGTDLGEEFDARTVLAPGMVLVIEPVIWDEGASGYRSEDIYAVTDDGWVSLSDYPYAPFG
jgi:Xaa-Pro dipeptidase